MREMNRIYELANLFIGIFLQLPFKNGQIDYSDSPRSFH